VPVETVMVLEITDTKPGKKSHFMGFRAFDNGGSPAKSTGSKEIFKTEMRSENVSGGVMTHAMKLSSTNAPWALVVHEFYPD
jgi:hypothetical protein